MIETYQISSKFAREIETALIESFYDAFGKNVKDCLGEITRGCFVYPPEQNTIFLEEYSYYELQVKGEKLNYILCTSPVYDKQSNEFEVGVNTQIFIGNSTSKIKKNPGSEEPGQLYDRSDFDRGLCGCG